MVETKFRRNKSCRICKSADIVKFLSLGSMPLANGFLSKEQLNRKESSYPLDVYYCKKCSLVQLVDIVPEDEMFKDYAYFSSTSENMKEHFRNFANDISFLKKDSFVIDIGSNDGILLRPFKEAGIRILGIEPAKNIAQFANSEGIETINSYWSVDLAKKIKHDKGKADVITCTNVFCHIDDLHEFMQAVDLLLNEKGLFVHEDPYLLEILKNNEFDQIYHEHMSYFSLKSLSELFSRFNMKIIDVKSTQVHGGSIRVFVSKDPEARPSAGVKRLMKIEEKEKINSLETLQDFSARLEKMASSLKNLLKTMKSDGKTVAGYGASSKGNVWLNYCKIGTDLLSYISDNTPKKQGLYTPGMHIPVVPTEKFEKDRPDYALLLAWNHEAEIMKKEAEYRRVGGKFIIPVPKIRVI